MRVQLGVAALLAALPQLADACPGSVGPNMTDFKRPVNGAIVRAFGDTLDPLLRTTTRHEGIDIGAPQDTAVVAAASGRVVVRSQNGALGKHIELDHGGDIRTVYGHLRTINPGIGDCVAAGQTIGTVGSTGLVHAPALHFEVRKAGEALDPGAVLK